VGRREGWNPDIWCIAADDCLVAIDARTGEQRWVAAHEGKGVNRVAIKRNDWGSSPCYAEGKVYVLGTTGRLYAHDAKTGAAVWESTTPGHEWMAADKAEALEAQRWAKSAGGLHTSPRVADGVVVAPALVHEGLAGFDAKDGTALWTLTDRKEPYQSPLATPRVWRHEGREYILAHNRRGTLFLVDPKEGKVLWRQGGNGNNDGTIPLEGDVALINVRAESGDEQGGLWGAYRLSLTGAEKIWSLPDEPKYWHQWKHDAGPRSGYAVRDGVAWLIIGNTKAAPDVAEKGEGFAAVELATGKILSETYPHQKHVHPQVAEDRLLVWADASHGTPWRLSYYTADPRGPRQLNHDYTLRASAISGYLVTMDTPIVGGRLYIRTIGGVPCFDLRAAE
jgi:outer membrane protein assembly factor BamB